MILRVKIKNFLSFYEETTFDMFPNMKRNSFTNHVYQDREIPLLKQAVIYGANGSGKSNLLKAVDFIRDFAIDRDFLDKEIISRSKFRLINTENHDPISLSIEFQNESDYFIYSIKLNTDSVYEELIISGIGKNDNLILFKREGNIFNSNINNSEEISKATNKLIKNNPYSSLLSLNNEFPIIDDTRVKSAHNWFKLKLKILSLNRVLPSLIELMSKNNNILKFANHIFLKIGLGIKSLEVKSESLSELINSEFKDSSRIKELLKDKPEASTGISKMNFDKVVFTIVKEKEEQIIKRFIFKQLGVEGFQGEMDIEDQSDGTVKLLNLIPALYDVIHKDCVICIDEIENSIHPSLITALISFYSSSKSKGQLIFSTHETELLNQQRLMRPDEVWFTEKHYGSTKLYSLNDFKEHNTINIRNGYLEGRYGAIPFIGQLEE
jgi:AAA15 family ATPase/GTPase